MSASQPQTIWMLIGSFYPWIGGAEVQAQALSEHLQGLGWSIHVITRRHSPHFPQRLPTEDTIRGISVRRVYSKGAWPLGALFYILAGLSHIARHRVTGSVYYAHDIGAPAWLGALASKILGGVCIVKIRSLGKEYATWRARIQLRLLRVLVKAFVAVSSEGRAVLERYGIDENRIWFIPNGVDTRSFYPVDSESKREIRAQFGMPVDKVLLLSVGRLIQRKGYDILLRACAALPSEMRSRMLIIIVGDGPEDGLLKRLTEEMGLQQSVRFEGRQELTRPYYQAADVFVLPTRGEGLSNAMLEAMACGLPMVCSATGGALDWIKPENNGLLFSPESIDGLKDAIIKMLSNESRWNEMGRRSREMVEEWLALSATSQCFHERLTGL